MAVLVESKQSTSTTVQSKPLQYGTSPLPEPSAAATKLRSHKTKLGSKEDARTKPSIDAEEAGNDEESNRSQEESNGSLALGTQQAISERRKVATRLAGLAQKLIDSHKSVKMAADIQVLRRELSRAHAPLRELRSERDYLSVVTLVEAAMQNIDWKTVSKDKLVQIKQSLAIGTSASSVHFDDVNRQARQLRGAGVSTLPMFEIDDGEEEATLGETDSTSD